MKSMSIRHSRPRVMLREVPLVNCNPLLNNRILGHFANRQSLIVMNFRRPTEGVWPTRSTLRQVAYEYELSSKLLRIFPQTCGTAQRTIQSPDQTGQMETKMNGEYKRKAPWIRSAIVIAALSITLSIGGLIDLLALSYVADAEHVQPSTTARSG